MKTKSIFGKLMSLILVVAILSASFALLTSCKKKNDESTTKKPDNNETTSEGTDYTPASANARFNGEVIRFIVEEGSNGFLSERSIVADESSPDLVDRAVTLRNQIVQSTLNVEIELSDVIKFPGLITQVLPSLTSGADIYDVIGGYRHYTISLAISGDAGGGLLLNFEKIPKNLNYIDLNGPHWSKETYEHMSYKGAAYWLTGDLALRYTGGFYVSYVNAEIWESNKEKIKEITGYDDIYALVNAGKWTIDVLHDISKEIYQDRNGNGTPDQGDLFGFTITKQDPTDGLIYGFGIKYTSYDQTGKPTLIFNVQNKSVINANQQLYKFFNQNEGVYVHPVNDDSVTVMEFFAEGNALATVNKLFLSEASLKNMEDDFFVVPVPKLSEAQENYSSALHDGCTIFGIPYTNTKVAATTATLDYMAYQSWKVVTPAYYDLALKEKYTRDEGKSAQMIDLVRESVYTDFIVLWSNSVDNCASFFRGNIGPNITSNLKAKERPWNTALTKLVESLEKSVKIDLTK